jgi:DNA-binding LytR/AlgR family response regulator
MKKMSILIADDEVLMCEELLAQLEHYQDIEVVAVCHDGDSALAGVKEFKPDIVFLDIQMPGKTGLDVAAILARQVAPPVVVFLTAFADYALKAFEVDAVDYVLKPFDEKDIQRVVSKLRKMQAAKDREKEVKHTVAEAVPQAEHPRKFCVHHSGRFEVIDNERILFFYAKDRLVFVQTTDDKHFPIKSSLNELEEKLDQKQFMRCHRNYIVNMDQIKHLENWFNRGYMLILKGETKTEVPVSRLFVKRLKEYLEFE